MLKQSTSTFTKFFICAALVIIFLAVCLTFALRWVIEGSYITHVRDSTGQNILLKTQDLKPENFSSVDPNLTKEIFTKFYEQIKDSDTLKIKVWDTNSRVIFSDDEAVVGKTFPNNTEYKNSLQGKIVIKIETESKAKEYKEDYKKALEMYIPVTFAGLSKPSGVIEVYISLHEMDNTMTQIGIVQVISTISFILAAFILFYILFKLFIYKSLNELINTAKSFEAGDLSLRVKIESRDEIGKLGIAFNNMASRLQEYYLHLEEKVKARTQELQKAKEESEKHTEQLEETKTAVVNLLEDLKVAKSEIESAKIKDDAIIENIGEGLIVTDTNGKISLINRAAATMLGWEITELLGQDLEKVLIIEDENGNPIAGNKRPFQKVIASCASSGCSIAQANYYVRKDKTKFPVSIIAAPIIINHKTTGVVEVFHDITREKEIDREKTEFLSIAAHQLRTPLGSMRWSFEMLLNGDFGEIPEDIKDMLTKVYESNQEMISLVNDLLDVSRIEQGRVSNNPKPTDIVNVLESTIDQIQIEAKNKGIAINFTKSHEKIPEILIDPLHLHQVITNLLGNAVKYNIYQGKVDINVEKLESSVRITFTNTGKSIPAEEQHRLFTRFFRGKEAVKSETSGTGLGLYVVKFYVDAWGGKVWVKSPSLGEDQGTTFYLEIPLNPKN